MDSFIPVWEMKAEKTMLNFDSWQRTETVASILDWHFTERKARVLDVGGYPGRMRTRLPRHDWVLCDPLVDAPGEQVKGSAADLPFGDATFDMAVSLDVLEHVPPEKRLQILDEMARVAREGMILTFPYQSPMVEAAEAKVRDAYRVLFKKDHPWLVEHQQYPLPDVDELAAHLRERGGQVAVLSVGSISHWVYLQLTDLLLEAMPNALELAERIDEFYQSALFAQDFNPPTYRRVIVYLAQAEEPIPLEFITTPRDEELRVEMELQNQVTQGLLKLFAGQQKEIETLQASQQQEGLSQDYVDRMEETVQLWEKTQADTVKELQASYSWRDQLETRRSFKFYKRVMRLLGWPVMP